MVLVRRLLRGVSEAPLRSTDEEFRKSPLTRYCLAKRAMAKVLPIILAQYDLDENGLFSILDIVHCATVPD